jgi:uncharacterized protein (DUF2249 family)
MIENPSVGEHTELPEQRDHTPAGETVHTRTVTLDVREDIRTGREPFETIMHAFAGLQATESLLLIAPFEPRPLLEIMKKRGYQYRSMPTGSGDYEVLFTRATNISTPPVEPKTSQPSSGSTPTTMIAKEVDARGLEPPQPLVRILEALSEIAEGAELKARTDRRPIHLYTALAERGFNAQTHEQPDGSFLTYIRRSQAESR